MSNDYHIGWICALSKEMAAATAMLDEEYASFEHDPQDRNSYALGRIHKHNVVIACMPKGVDGLVSVAHVARDMVRSFPNLRVVLMVGIGGGIPNLHEDIDIRLGDIVVSQPTARFGGVIQYDKGKVETEWESDTVLTDAHESFIFKGQLNQPPSVLLNAVSRLASDHERFDSKVTFYLDEMIGKFPKMKKMGYIRPTEEDCLFCSQCNRRVDSPASGCSETHLVRKKRHDDSPHIHYGIIASGNKVIKNATARDKLRDDFSAICVEMEAAGLMNELPCLVIRGICDYADSHKNDKWHSYAAATAAAYAKELLLYVSTTQASAEKPVKDVVDTLTEQVQKQLEINQNQLEIGQQHLEAAQAEAQCQLNDEQHRCHQEFKTSTYEIFKNNPNPPREEGTCRWVLNHEMFLNWQQSDKNDLLWISADPGCGKSVLSRSLVDNEMKNSENHTVCYFFFKDNEEQNRLDIALCALIHQLFTKQPHLVKFAIQAWRQNGISITKEIIQMWQIFCNAASDAQCHRVTCILDALDECSDSDRNHLIALLTKFYAETFNRPGNLRFLVTSRPYINIQDGFRAIPSSLPEIRLRGEDQSDDIRQEIDLVVRLRVHELGERFNLRPDRLDEILNQMLAMENRTYLWLHLAVDVISNRFACSLRPNEVPIDWLPSSVEDAYEKILSRINDDQKAITKKILLIVVGARRPLSIGEMAISLGVATTPNATTLDEVQVDRHHLEQYIREWCGLFIFVNHSRIYLIHQTARDFLLRSNNEAYLPQGWKNCFQFSETEREMARICTEYLLLEDITPLAESFRLMRVFGDITDSIDEHNAVETFLVYSAEHWPYHYRDADDFQYELVTARLFKFYDAYSILHNWWFPIFWQSTGRFGDEPFMNRLSLSAFLGHAPMMKLILEEEGVSEINQPDEDGQTALMWASECGYVDVVKILLENGAIVNAEGRDYAVEAAQIGGHTKVEEILLKAGAKDSEDNITSEGTLL